MSGTGNSSTGGYFVTRTVRALEALAFGPLSAPQLAEVLQVHARTARRMLVRLADEEYVVQLADRRRRYALSMRLIAVAGQALEHHELTRVAAPYVERLHAATQLDAHLVVPAHDRVACVAHGGAEHATGVGLRELVPAHCTAGGKALLSERDQWRERLLRGPLDAHTDLTVTDPGAVEREAEAARVAGTRSSTGSSGRHCTPSPPRSATAPAVPRSPPSASAAISRWTTRSPTSCSRPQHLVPHWAPRPRKAARPYAEPGHGSAAIDRHAASPIVRRRQLGLPGSLA